MPPTATPTLVARPLAPCTQYNYCYVASAYGELAVVPTSQLAWLVDHGTAGEKASSGDNLLQQQQHALCFNNSLLLCSLLPDDAPRRLGPRSCSGVHVSQATPASACKRRPSDTFAHISFRLRYAVALCIVILLFYAYHCE